MWITSAGPAAGQDAGLGADVFLRAVQPDEAAAARALDRIAADWNDGHVPMLLDLAGFVSPAVGGRILEFLEARTGERFGADMNRWRRWMWNRPYAAHPEYLELKSRLFSLIDPLMGEFLQPGPPPLIRLDEVQWGGVRVNGIPPLDHPAHVPASEAGYLGGGDVVFGVVVNGEARAYPKRILGWHEMALDEVGGVELTIIYCTLCGTVLPYESEVAGRTLRFGTSGLLYRSNKLFFDHNTASLWSTLTGSPVIGPLAGAEGVALRLRPSVTTTWREWVAVHPDTRVLSLDTGYSRDYAEGAAYRDYFATDALMFEVPETDDRLRNKDEVLVMRIAPASGGGPARPWAIAVDFLDRNRVYAFTAQGRSFLVVTTDGGANRVYETGAVVFEPSGDPETLVDGAGRLWRLEPEALAAVDDPAATLPRVTANRAFWFGWHAQFPETELIYE